MDKLMMSTSAVAIAIVAVPSAAAQQKPDTASPAVRQTAAASPPSSSEAAPPPIAAIATAPSPGTQPQTSPAKDSNAIGDIIVTATRREQSLQKTAVAVTAITSDTLTTRGAQTVADLTRIVPAVKIGNIGGSSLQVTVRGIGNFGGNSFAEPGVAFNLDGAYVARSNGASGIFYDVDRVELLKGPQGTLYGRNSTGGIINILTRDPGKDLGFYFTGETGNAHRTRAEAGVNLPITDWLAVRLSGQHSYSNGFTPDGYGAENNSAARIKVKLTPTTNLLVLLEADYSKVNDGPPLGGFKVAGFDPFSSISSGPASLQNTVIPRAPAGAPFPPTLQVLPLIKDNSFVNNSSRGLQGTINYDFGAVKSTLIIANRTNSVNYRHYGAGFPVVDDNRGSPSEYTTAELRLASNGRGPLRWVVGGFYFNDDLHTRLTFDQGVTFQVPDIHVRTKSYSGFAETTYSITDRFRLTAGGRYTVDEKSINGYATAPVGNTFAPLGGFPSATAAATACPTSVPGVTYSPATAFGPETSNPYFAGSCTTPIAGQRTFKKFTWKAGAEYDLGSRSLIYATVATGFKSGGFYSSLDTTGIASLPASQRQGNSYLPETLTAYTVGSKNRFFDNTLQLNVEGFYWNYKDKQYSHLGVIQPGNAANLVVDNAGAAKIYGAETELLWQPTQTDIFSVSLQYTHAEYTSFRYLAYFTSAVPYTSCAVGPITPVGRFNTATVDCTGKPVSFAPKWNANVSYYHTFDLEMRGKVTVGASSQVQSSYYAGEEFLPDQRQKDVTVSNAELTWRSADDHLGITAFVKNIEESQVLASSFVYTFNGRVRQVFQMPRTYGMRMNIRF